MANDYRSSAGRGSAAPTLKEFLEDLTYGAQWFDLSRVAGALSLVSFDDRDAGQLAVRGFDPHRESFAGVSVVRRNGALQYYGRCPQCPNDALCVHARAVLTAFRNLAQRYPHAALASIRVPFLTNPTADMGRLGHVSARARASANIFTAPLPTYRAPLPFALGDWLQTLQAAEPTMAEVEDARSVRFPDLAQLRFTLGIEGASVAVRPVYMAPGESHRKLRVFELDGPPTLRHQQILERLDARDRSWLRQLRAWPRQPAKATYRPHTALDQQLLGEVIAEGRVDLAVTRDAPDMPTPVVMAPAVVPALRWGVTNELNAKLELDLPPRSILLDLPTPWLFDPNHACVVPVEGVSLAQLRALRSAPQVPRDQISRFAEALHAAGIRLALPPPEAIPDPTFVPDVEPNALAVLSAYTLNPENRGVAADVYFRYGHGRVPAGERSERVVARHGGQLLAYARRPEREAALTRGIDGAGLRRMEISGEPHRRYLLSDEPVSRIAISLMARLRAKGVQVELAHDLGVQVLVDSAQDVYTDFEDTGGAMIGVDAGIVVDGERVPLVLIAQAALLDAEFKLAPGQGDGDRRVLVPLDDHRLVSLPHARVHELLAPFLEWLTALENAPRTNRPPRMQVPRTAMLALAFEPEDDRAAWLALPGMERVRNGVEALRRATHERVPVTPFGFNGELRDYQQIGVQWLNILGELGMGGLLADDMGLGKTIQVLAHVMMRRQQRLEDPVLVVTPAAVAPDWITKGSFTPSLEMLLLTGPQRAEQFDQIATADVVVVNYATFRLDIERLAQQHWSLIVWDESQNLKTINSQTHKDASRLQADRVLMVSGTPIENHLGELHSQFSLALPGLLGNTREFNRFYRTPIEKHGDDESRLKLRRRIAPFLLIRSKDEVAKDLPPKTEILRTVQLTPEQQKIYDVHKLAASRKVWDALHTRGLQNAQIEILRELQRLQLICCDPRLNSANPQNVGSAKLTELMELVKQIVEEQRHVLVVSQYVQFLNLIGEELTALGIPHLSFTGQTSPTQRAKIKEAYKRGEHPVLLLSLKAGGVGTEFTTADNVIIASPWWNPAAERQAIDRTHRIGQDKPVFAFRVICENTIEVEILARQGRKTALAKSILDKDATAAESAMTIDDVVALFGVDPSGRPTDVIAAESRVLEGREDEADEALEPDLADVQPDLVLELQPEPLSPVPAAPIDAPSEANPNPRPGRKLGEDVLRLRTELADWLRSQLNRKGLSVAGATAALGKEGKWLANRLGGPLCPLQPGEVSSLLRLLDLALPAHLAAFVFEDAAASTPAEAGVPEAARVPAVAPAKAKADEHVQALPSAAAPAAPGSALAARLVLARWLMGQLKEKGVSIPDATVAIGKEGQWLWNRLSGNVCRFPPAELSKLMTLLNAELPPHLRHFGEE